MENGQWKQKKAATPKTKLIAFRRSVWGKNGQNAYVQSAEHIIGLNFYGPAEVCHANSARFASITPVPLTIPNRSLWALPRLLCRRDSYTRTSLKAGNRRSRSFDANLEVMGLESQPCSWILNPVRRYWSMTTAHVRATSQSELPSTIYCVTSTVIGDMIFVLLMFATLII